MINKNLFRPLEELESRSAPLVEITFNGNTLRVPEGLNIAAALLSAGVRRFRKSPVSGEGRAPYCMMGVCFECLVEIDGVPNRQSCLLAVTPGMNINSQDSLPTNPTQGDDPLQIVNNASERHHDRD